jgi:Sulfotransferase family
MTELDADAVVDAALAMTEVPDPDVVTFRDNLDLLVDCINAEAGLLPQSVAGVQRQLTLPLKNRIEVTHWAGRHADIADEPIEQPIFLTGLPRSGTTYFQWLFDADPSMRMLRYWESRRPCPPPAVDPESARRRIEECKAEAAEGRNDPLRSEIAKIHLSAVEGPEECVMLIEPTFANVGNYWTYRVPTYFARCVDTVDLAAVYGYHKLSLQLLQWKAEPRRWVLKWPCHLVALDALLAVYPDASFVVTHRDPVQALASNCSLAALLRRFTARSVDLPELGQQMKDMIHTYLRRLVEFDERFEGRVAHVDYYTAVDEPEIAMADAFEALGLEMTPDVEASVVAWREENPPGKRGTHEYALDDYGLDADEVAEEYAFYIERFAIPAEGRPR